MHTPDKIEYINLFNKNHIYGKIYLINESRNNGPNSLFFPKKNDIIHSIIFDEYNPSKELIKEIKKEFSYPYNLKQIYILHSEPRDRKRYVITTESCSQIESLKLREILPAKQYNREILIKEYEEIII